MLPPCRRHDCPGRRGNGFQGLAEPLIDLRFGTLPYRRRLLETAQDAGLAGLTVFADARDTTLLEFLRKRMQPGSRVILSGWVEKADEVGRLAAAFEGRGVEVGLEVDEPETAHLAEEVGAAFVVASGNEAAGAVSPKTTLILAQQLLDGPRLPLIVRGGLGPRGAAAARAAGCAGCILDSQLLLLPECRLESDARALLAGASPLDTAVLGGLVGRPFRVLARGPAAAGVRSLVAAEREALLETTSREEAARRFLPPLEEATRPGFAPGGLPPVGQGIAFARLFAEAGLDLKAVLRRYREAVDRLPARVAEAFPFDEGAPLARQHGGRLPVVMGPMALVNDRPGLAAAVSKAGALPFVSAVGLSPGGIRRLTAETRALLEGRPFEDIDQKRSNVGTLNRPYRADSRVVFEARSALELAAQAGSIDEQEALAVEGN